jgi:alpha-1,3-glucosyltransferase
METMSGILLWSVAVLARVCVGLGGYSGAGTPPMYGDFEAQRHWLEITTALPVGDWYRHTPPRNDLQYWGLDYPPLTAYVSYLFGMLAHVIHPPLVELHASRGHESMQGKTYMRYSVILCDLLVFFPAIVYYVRCTDIFIRRNSDRKSVLLLESVCLLMPGLLLIDHGHFQYNAVCIGLALYAAAFILNRHYVLGSIFFCLSLNFKQMALYYAPVYFFALLRTCYANDSSSTSQVSQKPVSFLTFLVRLFKIGVAVLASFGALWAPFCIYHDKAGETCVSSLLAVLTRLFPFNRGLFEDKVANLWYAMSIAVDMRTLFPVHLLARFALLLTVVLMAPVCANLLVKPLSSHRFMLALVGCSLSFFLASFQVRTVFSCC